MPYVLLSVPWDCPTSLHCHGLSTLPLKMILVFFTARACFLCHSEPQHTPANMRYGLAPRRVLAQPLHHGLSNGYDLRYVRRIGCQACTG
jgi:hypothetical protein